MRTVVTRSRINMPRHAVLVLHCWQWQLKDDASAKCERMSHRSSGTRPSLAVEDIAAKPPRSSSLGEI